jgi:hypothetical protein
MSPVSNQCDQIGRIFAIVYFGQFLITEEAQILWAPFFQGKSNLFNF